LTEGQQFFAAAFTEVIAGHALTDGMAGLVEAGTRQVPNDQSDPFPEEGAALVG